MQTPETVQAVTRTPTTVDAIRTMHRQVWIMQEGRQNCLRLFFQVLTLASQVGDAWLGDSYMQPAYRFLVSSVQGSYTFSSLSVTGGGLAAVTSAAISAPIRHASALDLYVRC